VLLPLPADPALLAVVLLLLLDPHAARSRADSKGSTIRPIRVCRRSGVALSEALAACVVDSDL